MPKKKRYSFEQFSAVRRYGAVPTLSFSPDSSQIAYTVNTSGQLNLWRQSSDGGIPHQLTLYSNRTVRAVSWSPDGKWIAYNADQGGDEFHQLYVIPAHGGQPEQLTNLPTVQHNLSPEAWSPNGHYLAYSANDRQSTDMDILVQHLKKRRFKRVLSGDTNYYFGTWAPNNRRLIAVEAKSNTDFDLHLVHVPSTSSRLLTAHEGQVKFFPGPWASDGSGFYMRTDWDREFIGLAFYYVETGKWVWVETPEWDIEFVTGSNNGKYLAWVVNEDGYSQLYIRDLQNGQLPELPEIRSGAIHYPVFSPDGNKLAFFLTTPSSCYEIMVLDLMSLSINQITYSMLGGINQKDFVNPRLIRFPTHDKRKIQPGSINQKKPPVLQNLRLYSPSMVDQKARNAQYICIWAYTNICSAVELAYLHPIFVAQPDTARHIKSSSIVIGVEMNLKTSSMRPNTFYHWIG